MNIQETITSAIQSDDIEKLLNAYQNYTGNASATSDDLFEFLTFPSGEREEFLMISCVCHLQVQGQIVLPNYLVK